MSISLLRKSVKVQYVDHKLLFHNFIYFFLSFRPVDSYDIPKREEKSSGLLPSDRYVGLFVVISLE